ncbi:MAG: bifunctional phosphoribosyl-AMP cyclohydrolase/phosphoribosyl-ATP diphosphatase HisIE [Clostridia bacterium]
MMEQGALDAIRFDTQGLVPAVAQDVRTGAVLMLAYMNRESLALTLETGYATYWSRSRGQLWKKGETSGHLQRVCAISYDCDGDALLLRVEQTGPACHTGETSCFYRALTPAGDVPAGSDVLQQVYNVVLDRRTNPKPGSYTNYLLEKGVEKISKKVGEEAAETIIAAVKGNPEELRYEVADLFYHVLVLLANQGLTPSDIWEELQKRR